VILAVELAFENRDLVAQGQSLRILGAIAGSIASGVPRDQGRLDRWGSAAARGRRQVEAMIAVLDAESASVVRRSRQWAPGDNGRIKRRSRTTSPAP
jgi:hypothetical protein